MRKQTFAAISLCLAGLATAPALPAQTLEMANPPAATAAVGTPARGQTMAQVERQFGAPTERFAPVGDQCRRGQGEGPGVGSDAPAQFAFRVFRARKTEFSWSGRRPSSSSQC